jgi:hypothetical protein
LAKFGKKVKRNLFFEFLPIHPISPLFSHFKPSLSIFTFYWALRPAAAATLRGSLSLGPSVWRVAPPLRIANAAAAAKQPQY